MNRTCKCGGVIRDHGQAYLDTLPSCHCSNPEAMHLQSTYVTSTTSAPRHAQSWEEECDSLKPFTILMRDPEETRDIILVDLPSVKSFISRLLSSERARERERVVELVRGMKITEEQMLKSAGTDFGRCDAYNAALEDLITNLTNEGDETR